MGTGAGERVDRVERTASEDGFLSVLCAPAMVEPPAPAVVTMTGTSASAAPAYVAARGSVSAKAAPSPRALLTDSAPPCASTMPLLM